MTVRLPPYLLILSTIARLAWASPPQVTRIFYTPVETAISGTLTPFVLAVDGRVIEKRNVHVTELVLNGRPVPSRSENGNPFFIKSREDALIFIASTREGEVIRLPRIKLPHVVSASRTGATARLEFKDVRAAKMNGVPIKIVKNVANITIPETTLTTSDTHYLELQPLVAVPKRVYNVWFTARSIASRVPPPPTWRYLDFRLASLGALQRSGGTSIAAAITWNPSYRLNSVFSLEAGLGGYTLRKEGSGILVALEYGLLLNIDTGRDWRFHLGSGLHTWIGYGGTSLAVSGGIAHPLSIQRSILRHVDRVYVDYSVLLASELTHLLRVGIGIRL